MDTTNTIPSDGASPSEAPLSSHQQFLCLFDSPGQQGPFGPRYNITFGWLLAGAVDAGHLQAALDDVVARHEALRTVIARDGDEPHQRVYPPAAAQLTIRDLTDVPASQWEQAAGDLLDEVDAGSYAVDDLPLLRAVLGRFDQDNSVLVLIVHHTAADAWSMQVIMRDIAVRYAIRAGQQVTDLPEVPQYRDFVAWEAENTNHPSVIAARQYWQEQLQGAEMLAMRTDWPRSAQRPKATAWHRFTIDAETTKAVQQLARELRGSPFMAFLAAYKVLLHQQTGATDIVIPSFSPGRGVSRFNDTVGSFHNFLPLRTDLADCRTFREVLQQTRRSCVEAYSHDLPFLQIVQESPHLMAPVMQDDALLCAFQVMGAQFPDSDGVAGNLRYTEVRRRLGFQADGGDIPEGALWSLDILPTGETVGSLGYNANRWQHQTMRRLHAAYDRLLRELVAAPDAPLPVADR